MSLMTSEGSIFLSKLNEAIPILKSREIVQTQLEGTNSVCLRLSVENVQKSNCEFFRSFLPLNFSCYRRFAEVIKTDTHGIIRLIFVVRQVAKRMNFH